MTAGGTASKAARDYYEGISAGHKIWGIGLLTGLSMLGGYIRMTARDLAYGDQPRVPRNVGDAFQVGGAALHRAADSAYSATTCSAKSIAWVPVRPRRADQSELISAGSMRFTTGRCDTSVTTSTNRVMCGRK